MTYLHASPPRVNCPEHGVKQVNLPWAEAKSRFTILFESLAITVLLHTDIKEAAAILRISWDEAMHLMERAAARGLAAKPKAKIKRMGVDEKAVGRGQNYFTVVCDLERGVVDAVLEGRTKEALDGYFKSLGKEGCAAVEVVAMDMCGPYIQATVENIGREKIVFDIFHAMKRANEAVDAVRREEPQTLLAKGDRTLAETKYLWLYAEENLPARYQERFASLKELDLKTARAWAIKESLRRFWSYKDARWAKRLAAVVLLGDAQPVEADGEGGQDAEATSL